MSHHHRNENRDDIEPEVRKEMRVLPINMDDILEIEPKLGPEDVKGLSQRDERLVWEMAKLTQMVRAMIEIVVKTNNEHLTRIEANQIRNQLLFQDIQKKNAQSMIDAAKETTALKWQANIIKWAAVTGGGAAIVNFVSWCFHKAK